MRTHLRLAGLLVSVVALVCACGGASSQSSPSSPTATSAATSGTNGVVPIPMPRVPNSETAMGTVSDLGGTCPAVSFKLDGKAVKTDTATVFEGGACADLKNGVRAGAMGTIQADGSILARRVGIAPGPPPPPQPPPTPGVVGPISILAGTCPNLSMTVATRAVTTNGSTIFEGKACGDLKNGDMVGVVGSVPPGGPAIVAQKVMSRR